VIEPFALKLLGIALGLAGTGILAFRVTNILSALSMAVRMHDLNFQVQAARAEGRRDVPLIQMVGNDAHIDAAEKTGTKLPESTCPTVPSRPSLTLRCS
jgi:hypothetical protein